MATVIVYPNGDGTLTNWLNESSGSTNRYLSVDEGTDSPNDTDFINCTNQNTNGFLLLGNMPSDFGTATAVTIKMRTKTGTKGDYLHWDYCQIIAANEVDFITSSVSMTNGNLSATTYTYNPSTIFVTNKTGWDGAVLKFRAGTGTSSSVHLYAAQVEITYTPAASGNTYNETASGGASAAGSATISRYCNITASGGVSAAGTADISRYCNITASGGVSAAGTADMVEILPVITGSGGVSAAGTAVINVKYLFTTSGGASAAGSATININGQTEDQSYNSTYYPDNIAISKLRKFKIKPIILIRPEGFDY